MIDSSALSPLSCPLAFYCVLVPVKVVLNHLGCVPFLRQMGSEQSKIQTTFVAILELGTSWPFPS